MRAAYGRLTGGRGRLKVGGFRRLAFLALRFVAYSVPITLALLLIGVFLLDWGGSLQALALLAWLLIAMLLLLPLSLLNLPLIVSAWKERRTIISRDLLEPSLPPWLLKARWVVLAVAVAAAILALTVDGFGWDGFVLVLLVIVLPFLVLMLQSFLGIARRNFALMGDVQEILGVLEGRLAEARRESWSRVELGHEEAIKLSDTTALLLRSDRLRTLDSSTRAPSTQYSIAQSAAFHKGLQAHEMDVRLELLERVQELAREQQPQGARPDASGRHWVWSLDELGVELVYEIDDEGRQVLVREARSSAEAGGGTDGAG